MDAIRGFTGNYRWLSNFHEQPVLYHGVVFRNNEGAYQAAKKWHNLGYDVLIPGSCPDSVVSEFVNADGRTAKQRSRDFTMSAEKAADWNLRVKRWVMWDLQERKYAPGSELAQKLIATGDALLVELNWWHDTFFGVCDGSRCRYNHAGQLQGENVLGNTITWVRAGLQEQSK